MCAPGPVESFPKLAYWCQRGAAELGIELNEKQGRLFVAYYQLLLKRSQEINLTTILEEKDVALKHFVDSLTCLLAVPLEDCAQVIDVGTGAGLPGIPVKIVRPQIELTLIDSVGKKIEFIQEVVAGLGLTGAKAVPGRAEDLAHRAEYREQFDYVLSRALAPLPVLCEYCLGFAKIGGLVIALKGPAAAAEEKEATTALSLLGGMIREVKQFALPYLGHRRRLVVIEKIRPTPNRYPRRAGVPARRPL